MYSVIVKLHFCYAHRVRHHPGKCQHLHGHNATVEVVCCRDRLTRGMVTDFVDVKSILGKWLRGLFDHRTILEAGDPLANVLRAEGEPVVEIMDGSPTAEVLARVIYNRAKYEELPVVEVRLWETETTCGAYGE